MIVNTITQFKVFKPIPINEEIRVFHNSLIISETDTNGIITYANRRFLSLIGYTEKELIGMPHYINRHPDMPHSLFKEMWKVIKSKNIWRGYLKDLTKDGKYYWVMTWIQPKLNAKKEIIGYIAIRKFAYPEMVKEIEDDFMKLSRSERETMKYPYGGKLKFGSDFIGSKYLDQEPEETIGMINKREHNPKNL